MLDRQLRVLGAEGQLHQALARGGGERSGTGAVEGDGQQGGLGCLQGEVGEWVVGQAVVHHDGVDHLRARLHVGEPHWVDVRGDLDLGLRLLRGGQAVHGEDDRPGGGFVVDELDRLVEDEVEQATLFGDGRRDRDAVAVLVQVAVHDVVGHERPAQERTVLRVGVEAVGDLGRLGRALAVVLGEEGGHVGGVAGGDGEVWDGEGLEERRGDVADVVVDLGRVVVVAHGAVVVVRGVDVLVGRVVVIHVDVDHVALLEGVALEEVDVRDAPGGEGDGQGGQDAGDQVLEAHGFLRWCACLRPRDSVDGDWCSSLGRGNVRIGLLTPSTSEEVKGGGEPCGDVAQPRKMVGSLGHGVHRSGSHGEHLIATLVFESSGGEAPGVDGAQTDRGVRREVGPPEDVQRDAEALFGRDELRELTRQMELQDERLALVDHDRVDEDRAPHDVRVGGRGEEVELVATGDVREGGGRAGSEVGVLDRIAESHLRLVLVGAGVPASPDLLVDDRERVVQGDRTAHRVDGDRETRVVALGDVVAGATHERDVRERRDLGPVAVVGEAVPDAEAVAADLAGVERVIVVLLVFVLRIVLDGFVAELVEDVRELDEVLEGRVVLVDVGVVEGVFHPLGEATEVRVGHAAGHQGCDAEEHQHADPEGETAAGVGVGGVGDQDVSHGVLSRLDAGVF